MKSAAQKLKDSGTVSQAGFGMKLDPWYLEQWSALGGKTYVNNGNGRKSRATSTTFDNATGKEIFTFLNDMVKPGLARTNPADGQQRFDNLLGIGNGNFGMTIDTSAALGTIQQLLASGQYPNVELGVAPMPGPKGKGGVLVGGGANYIVKKSSPEKQAAAWQYAKFLNDPENAGRLGRRRPGTSRSASRRPTCRRCSSTGQRYPGSKSRTTSSSGASPTSPPRAR